MPSARASCILHLHLFTRHWQKEIRDPLKSRPSLRAVFEVKEIGGTKVNLFIPVAQRSTKWFPKDNSCWICFEGGIQTGFLRILDGQQPSLYISNTQRLGQNECKLRRFENSTAWVYFWRLWSDIFPLGRQHYLPVSWWRYRQWRLNLHLRASYGIT